MQIDDRPERIGLRYPADVGLVGDARATLQALIPLLERNEDRGFLEQAQAGMRDWWALMEERGTSDEMPMKPQVRRLAPGRGARRRRDRLRRLGHRHDWAARMRLRRGRTSRFSGTNCSMAAGAAVRDRRAGGVPRAAGGGVHRRRLADDELGDLATLVQHELPVKVIVIKNNTLGLIKWEQMVFLGNPEYGVELHAVDFVKVAEGVRRPRHPHRGARQLRANSSRSALGHDGPAVIEAVVDPNEPPLPPKITREQAKALTRRSCAARSSGARSP